jgi:formate-nitrite transporter family protein
VVLIGLKDLKTSKALMKERIKPPRQRNLPSEQELSPEEKIQEREEEEVQQRTAIGAHVVYEAILMEGENELKRPTSALAFSGLAAGLSMGFSYLTQGFLQSELPDTAWAHLIAKLGYSVGFLIVILGRQQLFTENTLTPILPLLKYKKFGTLLDILRLWVTVFLTNWVGTMLFAWVIGHSAIISDGAKPTFLAIGREAMSYNFTTVLVKAIFAGWLIALLVWLLPFAETGRVAVIIIMTYVIALGSFSHIIAGSVDTFYLVVNHERTWGQYLAAFMLPTLLGNIIGGVSLVAALNHAQVMAGGDNK